MCVFFELAGTPLPDTAVIGCLTFVSVTRVCSQKDCETTADSGYDAGVIWLAVVDEQWIGI